MRILQINTVCGYGSTGRIAVDIATEVERRGHQCYIAYGHGKTCYAHSYQVGSIIERKFHNILSRLTGRQALYSTAGTRDLIRWIEELQPDVIHLHNLHGHYLNVKILFEFLVKFARPVIWTLHDCWSLTGHCAHFDYAGCTKWQHHCNSCPNLKAYPPCIVDASSSVFDIKKKLFCALDNLTIVTPSGWLRNLVGQSFLSKFDKVVIHNGIDINLFSPTVAPELRGKFENKTILLGVSSMGFYGPKGLNSFIELSKSLDDSYQIILIGVTKKDRKFLPKNIIGIDRTNSIHDLVRYYSAADIFVNPTQEDTFPTTNLEALACGTPVLTFRTGGSPECIGDDPVGIIVEKGNNLKLADAIRQMNSTYKKQNSMKCRQKAEQNYNVNRFVDDYINLWLRAENKM